MMLQFELPKNFEMELTTVIRKIFVQAREEAKKDNWSNKDYLSFSEITDAYLDVSRVTLQKWIDNEGLPCSKIGGRVYIKKADLIDFMDSKRI